MRHAAGLVESMSDTLLGSVMEGDPLTNMPLDNVTLQVGKKSARESTENETISTAQGRIDMPPVNQLLDVNDDECVERLVRKKINELNMSGLYIVSVCLGLLCHVQSANLRRRRRQCQLKHSPIPTAAVRFFQQQQHFIEH